MWCLWKRERGNVNVRKCVHWLSLVSNYVIKTWANPLMRRKCWLAFLQLIYVVLIWWDTIPILKPIIVVWNTLGTKVILPWETNAGHWNVSLWLWTYLKRECGGRCLILKIRWGRFVIFLNLPYTWLDACGMSRMVHGCQDSA